MFHLGLSFPEEIIPFHQRLGGVSTFRISQPRYPRLGLYILSAHPLGSYQISDSGKFTWVSRSRIPARPTSEYEVRTAPVRLPDILPTQHTILHAWVATSNKIEKESRVRSNVRVIVHVPDSVSGGFGDSLVLGLV